LENLTPMMKQYMKLKKQNEDSILFFRLGDFYEMFFEDAIIAAKELEIALTQRDCGMEEKAPMCGVPHHVADTYISKLVSRGYKVAIGEQVQNPAEAKGIVKREVVRVITPGTITDTQVLDEKTNNFLSSIYMDESGVGLSYVDNSTGEMFTTEFSDNEDRMYQFIIDELGKVLPSEVICNTKFMENQKYIDIIINRINPYFNIYDDINKEENVKYQMILDFFKVENLNSLGIDGCMYSILSINKLFQYLFDTQKNTLDHINNLSYYEANNYMIMDINTRTNLEIHETILTREKKGSLVSIIDKTCTAMGGRLLRNWIEKPLVDMKEIDKRLNMVDFFVQNIRMKDDIKEKLDRIYDIERLSVKISNGNCNARDLISLKNSIEVLPEFKNLLTSYNNKELKNIGQLIDPLNDLFYLIDNSIHDNPPISITEGNLIKEGYNKELDDIKANSTKGKKWLTDLESKEQEKTGIKNLKVGYNKVAGYFIEVTKSNIPMVPEYFIRRQTLTNSERYYTEELKSMESKIIGAEEQSLELEYQLFQSIRDDIKQEIIRLQYVSKLISIIDVIVSFSTVANENNFVRPVLNNKGYIKINEGRHPVIEKMINNELFVPNDTYLDRDEYMIQIITGPNMSGKSTYMRQVAIITLMAQIGSFVPATNAKIGIVDRIFTRIGASDNLSQGESTFMVEMNEVANIMKNATKNSLIILDEIGRGTSTYDGLSIAWAVIEEIANNIHAKTLFATHYHELTQLEENFDQIKNMNISAKEKGDDIIFLRKIIKGSTNKSYGIQVARLAGIDNNIIKRSKEVLNIIENSHEISLNDTEQKDKQQFNIVDYRKEYFINKIKNINIDKLTPIESMTILNELIRDASEFKENE